MAVRERKGTSPAELSPVLRAWGLLLLVLAVGAAFSAAAFFGIRARDRELERTLFEHRVREHSAAIEIAIERGLDAVDDVGALFDSAPQISRSQFHQFVRHLLDSNPALQGLAWVPLVPAGKRAAYEQAAREVIPGYRFTEFNSKQQVVAASERAEHFPIYYAEARSPQGGPLGYDHASNASRLQALALSRDSGQIVATGRIGALGETVFGASAFVLFRPVYRKGASLDSPQKRHNALAGFTTAVFLTSELIGNVLDRLQPQGITVTLYDLSAPPPERFLAVWPASALRQVPPDLPGQPAPLQHSSSFTVGGRHWVAMFAPSTGWSGASASTRAWAVLFAGLTFSLLLAVYLRSEQRSARLMREQAMTDALTGLYNRRYLLELLPREFARAKRYRASIAAIMLDIDQFKLVNDRFGHQAGDVVLRELGSLLKASVRESDVACRYGGEEFVLILPEASLDDVRRRAEALRLAAKSMQLDHRGRAIGPISISLGIAIFPQHANDPEELLRRADQAMYEAKNAGRDTVRALT